ncbi:MAG: 4Fe-4S dicluster domain-containing protein [Deltaproteobacteria bacterium]|nr:4Fe-4S dicluster domain-containing protein [Deltaproteobacteria bacterium]
MKKRLLKKSGIAELVAKLAKRAGVFAPVDNEGNTLFQKVIDANSIAKQYVNSKDAPKGFFFPHSETLMRYKRTDKGMELEDDQVAQTKRILFGVRPCDARSFELLDLLFNQEKYSDTYFVSKRENTTVIVNACVEPISKNCFCTSLGLSPTGSAGADILMLDLGEEIFVEFITPKGEALLDCFGDMEPSATIDVQAVRERAATLVDASVPCREIKTTLDNIYEHPLWESIAQKCLACGTCTYLCPTCHCFDISDEVKGDDGARIRNWDSCMFPLFTKETSGHNPRSTQKARWRQRTMHKFKYFVDNFNEVLCVGCGRCVAYCPVNIDIREVVKSVAKI